MQAVKGSRHWLIVGAGYVGTRLCKRLLKAQAHVTATRRSEERCQQLREGLNDVSERLQVIPYTMGQTPPAVEPDVVVLTSPPCDGHPDDEAALAKAYPSARLIYLSTTGVYSKGAGDDEPVRDDHPLGPMSARGQARLDVEEAVRAVHPACFCLRVPGIYGPGRGVLARMLAGRYRIIGDGNSLVSRIHVDDLIEAIVVLAKADGKERVFVVGDESPSSSREHAEGVAARLNLPSPPQVSFDEVPPEVAAMLGADRGIVPVRLRALGWRPSYPSWREGLEQIIAEEKLER